MWPDWEIYKLLNFRRPCLTSKLYNHPNQTSVLRSSSRMRSCLCQDFFSLYWIDLYMDLYWTINRCFCWYVIKENNTLALVLCSSFSCIAFSWNKDPREICSSFFCALFPSYMVFFCCSQVPLCCYMCLVCSFFIFFFSTECFFSELYVPTCVLVPFYLWLNHTWFEVFSFLSSCFNFSNCSPPSALLLQVEPWCRPSHSLMFPIEWWIVSVVSEVQRFSVCNPQTSYHIVFLWSWITFVIGFVGKKN